MAKLQAGHYIHINYLCQLFRDFGKGLKVLSDRPQAVRKLLHLRVLHSRRDSLPTGPSKLLVMRSFCISCFT
jgi:hypothetical protein